MKKVLAGPSASSRRLCGSAENGACGGGGLITFGLRRTNGKDTEQKQHIPIVWSWAAGTESAAQALFAPTLSGVAPGHVALARHNQLVANKLKGQIGATCHNLANDRCTEVERIDSVRKRLGETRGHAVDLVTDDLLEDEVEDPAAGGFFKCEVVKVLPNVKIAEADIRRLFGHTVFFVQSAKDEAQEASFGRGLVRKDEGLEIEHGVHFRLLAKVAGFRGPPVSGGCG